jgi:hypothetical protein
VIALCGTHLSFVAGSCFQMSRYWTQQLLSSSLSDHIPSTLLSPPLQRLTDDREADRSLSKSEAELALAYGSKSSSAADSELDDAFVSPLVRSAYTDVMGRSSPYSLLLSGGVGGAGGVGSSGGGARGSAELRVEESKWLLPGQDFNALRCNCGDPKCSRMQLRYFVHTDRVQRTVGRGAAAINAKAQLKGRFVPMQCDEGARVFLRECYKLHHDAGFSVLTRMQTHALLAPSHLSHFVLCAM